MDLVGRIWDVFVSSVVVNIEPATLIMTIIFAIPAIIIGWLMLYFER